MGIEIERKFLVTGEEWRSLGVGVPYRQGYIAVVEGRTVRVRIAGETGYITIKGPTSDLGRAEFEYVIPLVDATELLNTLCDRPLIEKTRHKIPWGDLVWEVDEFHEENAGLILAEVELTHPNQTIQFPDWIGEEVSQDRRYFNAYLSKHPYREWGAGSGE